MKNASYSGSGKYDVRLVVDGVSFVVTVTCGHRSDAALEACAWAERNFRERLWRDTEAEVIGPHQG